MPTKRTRHASNLTAKNILKVTNERIPKSERHPDLYYYSIRHGDRGAPCSIELVVYVNHWGTVVTAVPLNIDDGTEANTGRPAWVELTSKHRKLLYDKLNGQG